MIPQKGASRSMLKSSSTHPSRSAYPLAVETTHFYPPHAKEPPSSGSGQISIDRSLPQQHIGAISLHMSTSCAHSVESRIGRNNMGSRRRTWKESLERECDGGYRFVHGLIRKAFLSVDLSREMGGTHV